MDGPVTEDGDEVGDVVARAPRRGARADLDDCAQTAPAIASGRLSRGLDVLMPPPGWEMTGRPLGLAGGPAMAFQGGDPDRERTPDAATSRGR